jgi:hypothetical protein
MPGDIDPMPMQPGDLPNLNVTPPPPAPDLVNQAAQLQGMRQSQAQTQGIQLENQQRQQQLKDQQLIQQYFMAAGQNAAGAPPAAGQATGTGAPPAGNPALTTAPPNAPPPPQGGYPVLPSGLIDRTGATPSGPGAAIANGTMSAPPGMVTPLPQQQPGGTPPAGASPAPGPQTQPPPAQPAAPPRNPIVGMDLGALARAGVSGATLQSLAGTQLKYSQDYLNLTKDQQAINDKNHADAASAIKGLYYASPADQQANYAGVRDMVRKLAPDDPALLPDQLPADPKAAQALLGMHLGVLGAHESIVANAKSAAETAKAAADTAEAQAKTPGLEADSRVSTYKANAMQAALTNSQAGVQTIQNALGFNPTVAKNFTDLYNAHMRNGDIAQGQAAIAGAIEYANKANPDSLNQAIQNQVKEQTALAPGKIREANATAAFTSSLENQRTAAAKIQDGLSEYNQSKATSETLQNMIDLSTQAKGGNSAAAQSLKQSIPAYNLAMFDIKRLAAMPGNEGLGSTADKMKSEATSLIQGKPLSDGLLNELGPVVKTVANGAAARYNGIAGATESAYPGYKAPRVAAPYPTQGAQTPAVKTQADYNALKSGTVYTGTDGRQYRKP